MFMADFSEEDKRILDYLRDSVSRGERYFRARQIADGIGLTAKQVGARLPRLAEESDDVEIEKWGRARSTTWRVTPQ
jgi:DNA-binding Lrp family transcriptional regulator